MAVLAIGIAGAAAGAGIAAATGIVSVALGAQIGWGIASFLAAPKQKNQITHQEPLSDLRITGVEYGQCIPWVRGHGRIAGQLWYSSDRRPIQRYTVTGGGGKGGGGGEQINIYYVYDVDQLYGLCCHSAVGITRVWWNGELVWNILGADTMTFLAGETVDLSQVVENLSANAQTDKWDRITFYDGAQDQLPDPTYEAAVGSDLALAYRGRSSVFIQNMHLGESGVPPQLTFELATKGTVGFVVNAARLYHFNNNLTNALGGPSLTAHGSAVFYTDPARFGYAVALGDYADTPDSGTGHFNFGTGEFGYDIQVYFNALPSGGTDEQYAVIAGSANLTGGPGGVTPTSNGQYMLFCVGGGGTAGALLFVWKDANGVVQQLQTSVAVIETGEWMHVAVVKQDTTLSLCVNGISVASVVMTDDDVLSGGSAFSVAGNSGTPPGLYRIDGYVDELRIVKGVCPWASFPFDPPIVEYTGEDLSGNTIDWEAEDLPDVVRDLFLRAGLTLTKFDVSQLSSITRPVRWIEVGQVAPTRSPLEVLAGMFYFDITVSDKIYCVPRGGAAAATIEYEQTGASLGNELNEDGRFSVRIRNDIEQPVQMAVSYKNIYRDYQRDTEYSDRILSELDNAVSEIQVPLALLPEEAKGNANTSLLDQVVALTEGRADILADGDLALIEPTDVVNCVARDGTTFRMRIVRCTDSFPMRSLELVLDDPSVLEDQGITTVVKDPSIIVRIPAATEMVLLDIPLLRDADDDGTGHYVVMRGDRAPWPGGVLMKSPDDDTFTLKVAVLETGIFGDCTSTLGDWDDSRKMDERSSVTVDVGAGVELETFGRNAVLDDQEINAAAIGIDGRWEIVQFCRATQVADGIYTLTRFLRGSRGTEWAMTGHTSGETFVLLRPAGMRRVEMETPEVGLTRYYRAVTLDRPLDSATSEQFSNDAVTAKPFRPANIRAERDVASGDVTFTVQRRSRRAVRMIGPSGISVPLGEEEQRFEIDILGEDSPGPVIRTLESTDTEVLYTAAEQAEDGITGQVTIAGYQISATVGRGYAYQATLL